MTETIEATERVMAVPATAALKAMGKPGGPRFLPAPAFTERAADRLTRLGSFYPRSPALETNEQLLQVIPYVVLTHRGLAFAYKRGDKGGERRLHAKLSLGVGGHWKDTDSALVEPACSFSGLLAAARRVRAEEVAYEGTCYPFAFAGLVYDDADPVGRVHLGVVLASEIPDPSALDFAPEVEPFGWVGPGYSPASAPSGTASVWEGWSALILPHLAAVVARGANSRIGNDMGGDDV